jgi:hypothetical protein
MQRSEKRFIISISRGKLTNSPFRALAGFSCCLVSVLGAGPKSLSRLLASIGDLPYSLFVIMPEHVHVIVHPSDLPYDIAWILKSIKQPVSREAHAWLLQNDHPWLENLTLVRTDGQGVFRF